MAMKIFTSFALLSRRAAYRRLQQSRADGTEPRRLKTADGCCPNGLQAKLPTMKIYLGAETLDAELALTSQQEMTGMMYRTNIQDTDAMLFVLPFTQRANFLDEELP